MSKSNIKTDETQETTGAFSQSKAVELGIFAILPDGTVLEDAEVETTDESIASSLRDITGSLRDIAKSLDVLPDYGDQLNNIIGLIEKHLAESPYSAYRENPPSKPSSTDKGGRYEYF